MIGSQLQLKTQHPWQVTVEQACQLQEQLARQVKTGPMPEKIETIAGIDAAYVGDRCHAAVAVMTYPMLKPLAQSTAEAKVSFPYRPGLLAFREGPAVLRALGQLKVLPDLLLFDGQGLAHPRGLGIASHLGVLMDHPTVGCAKTRLTGDYLMPGDQKGHWTVLTHHSRTIGAVVRTRSHVKPLFVSVGHRIDLEGAIQLVLDCCPKFRLPEPLRRAHNLGNHLKNDPKFEPSTMPKKAHAA